jgi:hypothetical protein
MCNQEVAYDKLPASRKDEAYRQNSSGWEEQMRNIRAHVDG